MAITTVRPGVYRRPWCAKPGEFQRIFSRKFSPLCPLVSHFPSLENSNYSLVPARIVKLLLKKISFASISFLLLFELKAQAQNLMSSRIRSNRCVLLTFCFQNVANMFTVAFATLVLSTLAQILLWILLRRENMYP